MKEFFKTLMEESLKNMETLAIEIKQLDFKLKELAIRYQVEEAMVSKCKSKLGEQTDG